MSTTLIAESLEGLTPDAALDGILSSYAGRPACLTCSFQAEDMIVLDLVRKRLPSIPVLFLETGYHFAQTYEYRDRIAREWKLNLVNVIPQRTVRQQESELGILYLTDPTKCCQLRKVEPLMQALEPYEIWFTGLRREQSPTRKNLQEVEQHRLPSGKNLLKISLLAAWNWYGTTPPKRA
jgi:phosphoadenosine phosphosulfate reductase